MAASELATVDDGGFVFKVRKTRLEELRSEEEPRAAPQPAPPPEASFEADKKKKRLLTLKSMYEAELKAWERLEAAATSPILEPQSRTAETLHLDAHTEMLQELKIEVENVEEYIKRLQDHVVLAESTFKVLVREMREDANFRPADEIVLALTGQGTTAVTASPESPHNLD